MDIGHLGRLKLSQFEVTRVSGGAFSDHFQPTEAENLVYGSGESTVGPIYVEPSYKSLFDEDSILEYNIGYLSESRLLETEEFDSGFAKYLMSKRDMSEREIFDLFRAARQLKSLREDYEASLKTPAKAIPQVAPVKWADRNGRENPATFIKRVYGEWIGHGLTRADILNLDKPLYMALASWLRTPKNALDFDLPTIKERNSRWVEQLAAETAPGPGTQIKNVQDVRRLLGVMRRRSQAPGDT